MTIDFTDKLNKLLNKINATGIRFCGVFNRIDLLLIDRKHQRWTPHIMFNDEHDIFKRHSQLAVLDFISGYKAFGESAYFDYKLINQEAINFLEIFAAVGSMEELELKLAVFGY